MIQPRITSTTDLFSLLSSSTTCNGVSSVRSSSSQDSVLFEFGMPVESRECVSAFLIAKLLKLQSRLDLSPGERAIIVQEGIVLPFGRLLNRFLEFSGCLCDTTTSAMSYTPSALSFHRHRRPLTFFLLELLPHNIAAIIRGTERRDQVVVINEQDFDLPIFTYRDIHLKGLRLLALSLNSFISPEIGSDFQIFFERGLNIVRCRTAEIQALQLSCRAEVS